MTATQKNLLLYSITTVTGIQDLSSKKLKAWLAERGIEVNEKTFVPPAGKPAFTCSLVKGNVVLHTSSGSTQEKALNHCVGEFCKDRIVERHMFMNS